MNITAVPNTVRPYANPVAVSTPYRDLLGCFALSAGLGAGLSSLAGLLAHLAPGVASGLRAFLGLG